MESKFTLTEVREINSLRKYFDKIKEDYKATAWDIAYDKLLDSFIKDVNKPALQILIQTRKGVKEYDKISKALKKRTREET